MARLCLECGGVVPDRDPHRHGTQPLLCSAQCKVRRRRKTTALWIKANHDRKLSGDAKYRELYKQTKPDYFREHYAKNREKRKRQANEWYHANSEYALEQRKVYVAANPEKARAWGRKSANKRRAIKQEVFVEVVEARVVFDRDKGQCGICGEPVDPMSPWEVDHIVPISKGGAHGYANVQLSHRSCNRKKHDRIPKGQRSLFQVVVK